MWLEGGRMRLNTYSLHQDVRYTSAGRSWDLINKGIWKVDTARYVADTQTQSNLSSALRNRSGRL